MSSNPEWPSRKKMVDDRKSPHAQQVAERHAKILKLSKEDGLLSPEIAVRLGISESSVRRVIVLDKRKT